jgi:hypothetical protein
VSVIAWDTTIALMLLILASLAAVQAEVRSVCL